MEATATQMKDLGWNHGFLADPKIKNNVTCKYCSKVTKGGIYRLKQHLAGGYRSVTACQKYPEHVRDEMMEYMVKKKEDKEQMNLVHDSNEMTDFDEEDEVQVVDNKGKGKKHATHNAKRVRNVGPMDGYVTPLAQTSGKQKTLNESYKKEQRKKACADFARWMYDAAIPFNTLTLLSFSTAIDSITKAGIGMKPPTAYEVRVPLLKQEVSNINETMKSHTEEWARTGCSIMSDGWTDRCGKTIINFLVNCSKGGMFLESIDASSYSKTGDKLFSLLSKIIDKVGERNVVQVITDNGSNFVAAGKKY